MDTEKFEIWTMEYLSGELDQNGRAAFEKFVAEHPKYKEQWNGLVETWDQLDSLEVPEPSAEMDGQFYQILHRSVAREEGKGRSWSEGLRSWFGPLFRPQLAYGALLLGIGLAIGYFLNTATATVPETTVVESSSETEAVRGQLVLTLLEQPSANQRLQGVNEANKIAKVDEKVIKALLQTLNNDPNVNVRLAAIESLTNYVDDAAVREGLVQSIVHQESPIVQVTLANLMVALQEKKSIEPFKTLMRSKELDTSVKQKLESTIQQII